MSRRPSAEASASPESNALSVHHAIAALARPPRAAREGVTKSPAPRSTGLAAPAVAALHAASRNSRLVSQQRDRAGDGALGVDERDRRSLGQVVDDA